MSSRNLWVLSAFVWLVSFAGWGLIWALTHLISAMWVAIACGVASFVCTLLADASEDDDNG